jgi:serine protease
MRFNKFIVVAAITWSSIASSRTAAETPDYTSSILKTLPPHDMVQVIVMHKNCEGKQEVEKMAQRLVGEIPRFNIVVATMMVHNVDGLRHSPNIHGVDLDKAVKVTPKPLEEFDDHDLVRRRAMKEEVSNGVKMVQAEGVQVGRDAVKICVVDSGYSLGHEDLPKDPSVVSGTDNSFYRGEESLKDRSLVGHGSHAAGIIAAIGDNDLGVAGVIPQLSENGISLHISRGLSQRGHGTMSGILNAISNCVDAGAKVVNLSLGHDLGYDKVEAQVFNDLYARDGVLMVAGAGNSGTNKYAWPASYSSVISVAAVHSNGVGRAAFSQSNDQVELAGPGISIKSTVPFDSYKVYSGTSVAAPHVSAVAALVWSHNTSCTNVQIRRILLQSAKQPGRSRCDDDIGYGLVQAQDAIALLKASGCNAGDVDLLNPVGLFEGCNIQRTEQL